MLARGADASPLHAAGGAASGGRSWREFCEANEEALQRAERELQWRLEQQWHELRSSAGGGDSSGSAGAPSCPICMTEPGDFLLDGCCHSTCLPCLRTHAATEVKEGRQPRCPLCMTVQQAAHAGAAGTSTSASSQAGLIGMEQLELLLDEADLLLLARRQLEEQGIRCCPHCSSGLELGPGVDLFTATCPFPGCGKSLHVEDAAAERALRAYSQQRKLRQCRQCGAVVEKTAGCNKVACRCGAHMCYLCGTTLDGSSYAHFGSGRCRLHS